MLIVEFESSDHTDTFIQITYLGDWTEKGTERTSELIKMSDLTDQLASIWI